jgi:hypothetical protein
MEPLWQRYAAIEQIIRAITGDKQLTPRSNWDALANRE